ncbi:tRNase Z TRZ1-like isoform X2 [Fagus crenata]
MSDSYFIVRLRSRASRTASHGFSVEFFMFRLVYFGGDRVPRIIQDSETVWLPNCSVLLHDNGYHLSYLLKDFNFPREKHGEVSRNIAAVARGSETSRKPIIVHLYRTITMYSSLDTVIWKGIPATKSSIQALEKVRLQPDSVGDCIICLQEFEIDSEVTRMPCSHVYHGDCIVKWLETREEFHLRRDLKVRAFKTYHVIPSQKLKQEYIGLPGNKIKNLKSSGVEITYTVTVPEIAFTGDTMSDFIIDQNNIDVLRSRILVMESTFLDKSVPVEGARDYGHTHICGTTPVNW